MGKDGRSGRTRANAGGGKGGTLQTGVHDIFQTITGQLLLGNLKLCAVQRSAVQYGGAVVG